MIDATRVREQARAIAEDPASSFWLRDAVRALLERDPVDAVVDVEVLASIFSSPDALRELADRLDAA